jgi:hypothetical protein
MILAGNDRTIHDVGQSVAFGDKTFKVDKKSVYFGSPVIPNNDMSREIQRRIQIEIDAFSDCANNCSLHVEQNSTPKRL